MQACFVFLLSHSCDVLMVKIVGFRFGNCASLTLDHGLMSIDCNVGIIRRDHGGQSI